MLRRSLATLIAGAALLGATAAHAGTHWSIGINLPPADIVVSNGGRYVEQAPVYYAPPPVVYAPAPRYVEREVYYAPPRAPRVVYETSYRDRRWDGGRDDHWHRDHDRHDNRWDRRDNNRDDYGPRRGR
jgi:hypothetical protein